MVSYSSTVPKEQLFLDLSMVLLLFHLTVLLKENSDFTFNLTYNFCYEFIEIFFNTIRLHNGLTSKPTAQQFQFPYRHLLLHADNGILNSLSSNTSVLDNTTQFILKFINPESIYTKFSPRMLTRNYLILKICVVIYNIL